MNHTNCVFVLGMHRSGTSALAGCMHLMGLNLGNALMPGNQANQSGYFENQDIVLAHDILFRDLGCRWDMVGSLPQGWTESQAADKAVQTLTGIVKTQFLVQNRVFAVKDPRLGRLMPLWTRVLHELDIHPCVVFMLRHPMEVAKSLHKRDGFDLLKGHLLWLVHNREALAACRELDHTVLTYDQLLADPIGTLKDLSALPALSGLDPLGKARDILGLIRPELKNEHQSQAQEIKEGLFQHYAWIYDQFRSLQARTRLARLEQTQGHQSSSIFQSDVASQFPLAISDSRIIPVQDERRHAAEVLDNLLQIISSYEQSELDLAIQRQRRLLTATNAAETIFAQVYFSHSGQDGYLEERSQKILLAPEEWQQVRVDISDPLALRSKGLRLDPLNTRGVVFISAIKLINAVSGGVCWSVHEDFSGCAVQGDALVLSGENGLELVVTGNDPRVILPELPDLPDVPMQLEFWIKAGRRQDILHTSWQDLVQHKKKLHSKKNELQEEKDLVQASMEELQEQIKDLEKSLEHKDQAKEQVQQELESLKQEFGHKERSLQQEQAEKDRLQEQIKDLEKSLEHKDQAKEQVQQELESLKQEFGHKERSLQQEQAEKNRLQEQIQELEKDLHHTEQSRDQAQQELERQKALALEYSTSLSQAEQEQQRLQAEVSERDEQLADLGRRLETKEELIQEYVQALSEADAEQDALHTQVNELKEKNEQLTASKNKLQGEKDQIASTKAALEERLQSKDRDVRDLEDRLHRQEDLTRRYFRALADAESDQQKLRVQVMDLEEEKKQLQTWMRQLSKDTQGLVGSLRWKMGNFLVRILELLLLRGRQPTAVDHMQKVVNSFAQSGQASKAGTSSSRSRPGFQDKNKELLTGMRQAHKDYQALRESMRWKIGNAFVRSVELMLFRRRPYLAMDHLQKIFSEFEQWNEQTQADKYPYTLSFQKEKQLEKWLRQVCKDVQAVKNSQRWKVGNALVRGLECMMFRSKKPLALEHLEKICQKSRISSTDLHESAQIR